MKKRKRPLSAFDCNGFTLVELLMALIVTSIVLAAVVTLAFALNTANDVTDNTSQIQAQVRYATLRISELIRHCKLICGMPGGDLAVWRADDNDNGQINISELVYIERGPGRDYLRLCEFSSNDPVINISDIGALITEWWLSYGCSENYTLMIPQCSNVEFLFDVSPPNTGFVSISFDVVENNVDSRYQINAAIHGWSGNLLDSSGEIVSGDDD
jgi:prepilin-type N-terminal cleavage/methylation domain-containing protein